MYFENDNELIYMIHQNDDVAMNLLIEKYKRIVYTRVYKELYYFNGHDLRDDLYQVGILQLYECVVNYNPNKDAKFATYYNLCLNRRIHREKSLFRRGVSEFNSISLDQYIDDQQTLAVAECVASNDYCFQGDSVFKLRQIESLIEMVYLGLKPIEVEVCRYQQEGYTYSEISNICGIPLKKIDYTIQKFRKKLLTELNGYDKVIEN